MHIYIYINIYIYNLKYIYIYKIKKRRGAVHRMCSRPKGAGVPRMNSIHPPRAAAVGPLTLHIVPQGHGGGYNRGW